MLAGEGDGTTDVMGRMRWIVRADDSNRILRRRRDSIPPPVASGSPLRQGQSANTHYEASRLQDFPDGLWVGSKIDRPSDRKRGPAGSPRQSPANRRFLERMP
jgi:hypothetical protein